jgi:ABC-2 type transport system ATP-binding protein
MSSSPTSKALAIDVKGLCKQFAGKPAVINVSLQVKRGEIYGFLGPNGSGKTTTLRMLCGLLTPDAGSGQCLSHDVIKESAIIRRQVGYMTQRFSLYEDLTIEENLNFVAGIYEMDRKKQRVLECLEQLGLMDRRNEMAGRLSGGWKQRLALAAALLHEPQLLLLDEPTAGVDPKARREFWDHLHLLSAQGITTLVTTHYMDEAERCHRLAYIAYAHLLVKGTAQEIIQQVGLSTWSVKGDNLITLAEQLRALPDVEQVVAFGNELHISGKNAEQLAESIRPFQHAPYIWTPIPSSLEDVFIHLVDKNPDVGPDVRKDTT